MNENDLMLVHKIINNILTKSKKTLDFTAIRAEILKRLEFICIKYLPWEEEGAAEYDDNKKYAFLIRLYLDAAILNGDTQAFNFFRDVFYEKFVEPPDGFGKYWATYYAINLVGLHSLCELMLKDNLSKKHSIRSGFIFHLYFRAYLESPLIILGETGTGKELIGKVIHTLSQRRHKPYQEINCAAIPEKMLESELFGYEAGAFTDAKKRKSGLLELANGGIIFLDEIGKMSPQLQAKILKVIEEKKFFRLGGERSIQIDVRFIAAMQPSNKGNILPDLLYRLGYPDVINLPTLNETLDKIGEIVIKNTLEKIADKMAIEYGCGASTGDLPPSDKITEYPPKIDKKGLHILLNHRYKGNYRELENILRGAMASYVFSPRNYISADDLCLIDEITENHHKTSEGNETEPVLKNDKIKLIDIITHANGVRSSIVEERIKKVLRQGIDIKAACLVEGLPEKEYQNFWKQIVKITGKNIRALKRSAYTSNG